MENTVDSLLIWWRTGTSLSCTFGLFVCGLACVRLSDFSAGLFFFFSCIFRNNVEMNPRPRHQRNSRMP